MFIDIEWIYWLFGLKVLLINFKMENKYIRFKL